VARGATLRDLLRLMGRQAADGPLVGDDIPLALWRLRRGATLLHEGGPAHSLYLVRSGSLKCLKSREEGYEQVLAFAQPGDLLGFEALNLRCQPMSAVALEDASAYVLPLRELPELRRRCPMLDEGLQHALSRQLVRAGEVAEMMSAVVSDVRLVRFLLWQSARLEALGQSPRRFVLRMGRRDIASLLALAPETLSRSFTTLVAKGCLKVRNREVELLDVERLRAHGRCTRNARAGESGPERCLPHAIAAAGSRHWPPAGKLPLQAAA
jgi:CRP/FNR family transcriptional regulator